jgi:hypothetical protein
MHVSASEYQSSKSNDPLKIGDIEPTLSNDRFKKEVMEPSLSI